MTGLGNLSAYLPSRRKLARGKMLPAPMMHDGELGDKLENVVILSCVTEKVKNMTGE